MIRLRRVNVPSPTDALHVLRVGKLRFLLRFNSTFDPARRFRFAVEWGEGNPPWQWLVR